MIGALLDFLTAVKSGRGALRAPIYSHRLYDRVKDRFIHVDQPDILIVEGLNVLQTGKLLPGEPQVFVSDFFDFSIYIDADQDVLRQWYVQRFLTLRSTVFNQPDAYFKEYAKLSESEAIKTANRIWRTINQVNLHENIEPTKYRSKLILHKGPRHAIDAVHLRKL